MDVSNFQKSPGPRFDRNALNRDKWTFYNGITQLTLPVIESESGWSTASSFVLPTYDIWNYDISATPAV